MPSNVPSQKNTQASASKRANTSAKISARVLAWQLLQPFEKPSNVPNLKADELLNTLLESGQGKALPTTERALLTHLVYGTLRQWQGLGQQLRQLTGKPLKDTPPKLRTWLRLGLFQLQQDSRLPAYAVVHSMVQEAKALGFSRGQEALINALLRKASPVAGQDPVGTVASAAPEPNAFWPPWLHQALLPHYGAAALEAMAKAAQQPAPLCVRVNPHRSRASSYAQQLQALGVKTLPLPQGVTPSHCLLLQGWKGSPTALPQFEAGAVHVLDVASAWVAEQLPLPSPLHPAHQPWVAADVCAAPGSKTLCWATAMHWATAPFAPQLFAVDAVPKRLLRLEENLKRFGLSQAPWLHRVAANAATWQPVAPLQAILLDAPCTGTGTLRRHPELLLRLKSEDVVRQVALQHQLLTQAAYNLAVGGTLVYSTCSLLPAENAEGLAQWLQAEGRALGLRLVSQQQLPITAQHDGFFWAKLRKVATV